MVRDGRRGYYLHLGKVVSFLSSRGQIISLSDRPTSSDI